jgi:hypothetical protein
VSEIATKLTQLSRCLAFCHVVCRRIQSSTQGFGRFCLRRDRKMCVGKGSYQQAKALKNNIFVDK